MESDRQKTKLLAERAELLKKLSSLESDYSYEFADDGGFEGDRPGFSDDNVSMTARKDKTRLALHEVNIALKRLEAGTYGKCVECGKDIDAASLDKEPSRSLCCTCRDAEDEWYNRFISGIDPKGQPAPSEISVGEHTWQEWEWVAGNSN